MSVLAIVERTAHRRLDRRVLGVTSPLPCLTTSFLLVDHYTKEVWINLLGLPRDHPEAQSGAGFLGSRPCDVGRGRPPPASLATTGRSSVARRRPRSWLTPWPATAAAAKFGRTSFPEPAAWREALRCMLSAPAEDIRAEFAKLVEVWLTHVFAGASGPAGADAG